MEKVVITKDKIYQIEKKSRREFLLSLGFYNCHKNKTHKSKKTYHRNKKVSEND